MAAPPTSSANAPRAWFLPDESLKLTDRTREIFEEYSKIPSDQVVPHILKVRKEAWDLHPYPCLGGFCFLDMSVHDSDMYQTVTVPVIAGEKTYLDLGCGLGQDLRALVHDGAPPGNLYAADIMPEFLSLGSTLFLDADNPPAKFFTLDILTMTEEEIVKHGAKNKMDIIQMAGFLHLFDHPSQIIALKNAVNLLAKNEPGVIMIGRQVGTTKPGEWSRTGRGKTSFHHNEETFKELWGEIGKETGTEWEVDAKVVEFKNKDDILSKLFAGDESKKMMLFKVVRVK